ncbi:asparagine synthase (glutamine-hydrolyzing) [Sulfurospirillum arsenophilum]|uniref:asparagine synthase (glutamine-hydrolyzing) n=1 Tax=Sulfurospirillum arsenophilum TaxID=56698 RepID=UPI0005A8DCBE|nr:asparagine synthase (glutamine-hydrolyzing) [Sulfurospirillum arsenophilum]
MCGIAGAINGSFSEEKVFSSLFHRGPNEQSKISYQNVTLFHTRLSIQDVAHGQQPLSIDSYVIAFNGEIYNHQELRQEHLCEFDFMTSSDTETLLYMYIKYKEKMFDLLDGMFAFAILDKESNKLFLARDRAGKKPLYIYQEKETIFFASELNAIKSVIPNLQIDEQNIYFYLRSGFFYKQNTPYKNVYEIENGTFLEIDLQTLALKKKSYFNMLDLYLKNEKISLHEGLLRTEEALKKSVKERLLSSDLEVGAFLSGGIDSSLIVACASEYRSDLKTFTVKFNGAFDESSLALLTAQKYGTQHTQIDISMNLKNDIETILRGYGEPFFDSSAIPSYYVSQEAKKHLTVILNGDGADELFGGYRRYVPLANGWLNYARYFACLTDVLPKPHDKKSLYNYAYRLLSMSKKTGLDFYCSATNDIFEDVYTFENNAKFQEMDNFVRSIWSQNTDDLSKMLCLDFELLLFSDLLVKMDIATMAHSLEGRSPFLSKYMLELAPSLDVTCKINGKETKHLLRTLAKKYLPSELINQPKRGFEVPLKKWVENDLKENIFDALGTQSYSSSFIDKKFIDALLANKINVSAEKRAKMLWSMYCLEVWRKNV